MSDPLKLTATEQAAAIRSGTMSAETLMQATLARIEKMDFNSPIFLGEVAEVHADVAFTSTRSLLVVAKVYGENVITGLLIVTIKSKTAFTQTE